MAYRSGAVVAVAAASRGYVSTCESLTASIFDLTAGNSVLTGVCLESWFRTYGSFQKSRAL